MSHNSEMDDFWDISKLTPKKKKMPSRFVTSPVVSEVTVGSDASARENSDPSERKLNFGAFSVERKSSEPYEYEPIDRSIIKKVKINPSRDRFDFYDTFRKAALIYYDYKCAVTAFVPFYSYKPQYSQMSVEQKKYYFYWRDQVRRKNYLKTDYSYIYLYAYEILNLPDKIGKEEGLTLLCDIFKAYYKEFTRLPVNFSIWIQDYCLVHELECPHSMLNECLFEIIGAADLKEFYLSGSIASEKGTSALIACLSDYDWMRGKYANVGNAEEYRNHILGAMKLVLLSLLGANYTDSDKRSKLSRQAFPGSLCTHSVKCFLEVEYVEFSTSAELRKVVTEALKYTENKIRTLAGIKSRLAVRELKNEIKSIIDRYFKAEFVKLKRKKERENAPEYEKLYDALDADKAISLSDAIEIERASWKNTAKLIEGTELDIIDDTPDPVFSHSDDPPCVSAECGISDVEAPSAKVDSDSSDCALSHYEISYLKALTSGDIAGASLIAKESGAMLDSIAEKINEVFYDIIGDVVLEKDGDYFTVVEDYLEDIKEWLISAVK